MAVWVDDMRIVKHQRLWCHLVADSWEEMHAFALLHLQLESRRFHRRAKLPHYDITVEERELALRLGAQAASQKDIVRTARQLLQSAKSSADSVL